MYVFSSLEISFLQIELTYLVFRQQSLTCITDWTFLTSLNYLFYRVFLHVLSFPRKWTPSWAFRSASFQLYPISFSSASVYRSQLFLARALFLFGPLRIPVVRCVPQGATNPAPFPSQNLFTSRLLFRSLPKFLFANFLRILSNVEDASQTTIYENLDLLECLSCPPPRLRSIEKNWFHNGIEDA